MQNSTNIKKGKIIVSFKQLMFLPSFINVILIIFFALELIIENSFTTINLYSLTPFLIFFPIFILIYLPSIVWYYFKKWMYIKYNEKGIILTRRKKTQSISWETIKEIKLLPFGLIIRFMDESSFVFPFPVKGSAKEFEQIYQEYIMKTIDRTIIDKTIKKL